VPQDFPLVIVGGNNLIATYLIKRLSAQGFMADVISRSPVAVPIGFTLIHMDLTSARNWIAPENAVVISLLPLWVLAQFLPRFIGVKSIIAIGSTSLFSKAASPNSNERAVAASLESAENAVQTWCRRSNVQSTILRPTMVYDGVNDKNIARMARFIRRFHFLPLAAPAKGLRQPIHADDVAQAIIGAVNNSETYGKALNIAGGEVLTYRAMVERVFAAQKIKLRLLMLPIEWLAKAFNWASSAGIMNEKAFGSSIFQRMNEDLVFDVEEGLRLLNYQPRKFEPGGG
jgi:nucleoside-diphosphate-sugar epimerase